MVKKKDIGSAQFEAINLTRLMKRLNYEFNDVELLKQALTHRSSNHHRNYERLEFLGDALLSSIIAERLYFEFPDQDEGRLTRMRATLVRQESLAVVAIKLQLGEMLILGAGELKSGGSNRESLLSDALEAIIGAIYLDCHQFATIQKVVLGWFKPLLDDIQPSDQLKDAKTRLQEFLQKRRMTLPRYEMHEVHGDAPKQRFTIHCYVEQLPVIEGVGSSRRIAEQRAAEKVLIQLQQMEQRHV